MPTKVGDLYSILRLDSTQYNAAIKKAQADLGTFSAFSDKAWKKIGMAAKVGLAAVVAGLAASVKAAASFESQMDEVSTMLDKRTMPLLEGMEKDVLDLSKAYGQGTKTLTKGLYDILSASIPAADAMGVLETSAQLAVGGLTDTGTAADALTTLINAFGGEADDAEYFANLLFATVKRGKTTMSQLAPAIGGVATIAAQAGISFEEVSAQLAIMTRNGISTDKAVTFLRSTIATMIGPTEDALAAAEEFGVGIDMAAIQAEGFSSIMEKLGNLPPDAIKRMFPNIRAIQGVFATSKEMTSEMERLAIITRDGQPMMEAFNKNTANLTYSFNQLKQEVIVTAIEIGNKLLPKMKDAVESIKVWVAENRTNIIKFFTDFYKLIEDSISFIVKYKDGLIVLGTTLLSLLIVDKVTKAFWLLHAAMLAIQASNPAFLIAGLATAVVTLGIYFARQKQKAGEYADVLKLIGEKADESKTKLKELSEAQKAMSQGGILELRNSLQYYNEELVKAKENLKNAIDFPVRSDKEAVPRIEAEIAALKELIVTTTKAIGEHKGYVKTVEDGTDANGKALVAIAHIGEAELENLKIKLAEIDATEEYLYGEDRANVLRERKKEAIRGVIEKLMAQTAAENLTNREHEWTDYWIEALVGQYQDLLIEENKQIKAVKDIADEEQTRNNQLSTWDNIRPKTLVEELEELETLRAAYALVSGDEKGTFNWYINEKIRLLDEYAIKDGETTQESVTNIQAWEKANTDSLKEVGNSLLDLELDVDGLDDVYDNFIKRFAGADNPIDGLRAAWQGLKLDVKDNKEVFKDFVDVVGGLTAESFVNVMGDIGTALGKGESGLSGMVKGLKDIGTAIINALPELLTQAGLMLIGTGTPVGIGVGLGMIAAGGLIKLATSFFQSKKEKEAFEAEEERVAQEAKDDREWELEKKKMRDKIDTAKADEAIRETFRRSMLSPYERDMEDLENDINAFRAAGVNEAGLASYLAAQIEIIDTKYEKIKKASDEAGVGPDTGEVTEYGEGLHAGGIIGGKQGIDRNRIRATKGEYVMPVEQTNQNIAQLEAMRLGQTINMESVPVNIYLDSEKIGEGMIDFMQQAAANGDIAFNPRSVRADV
jgi:TP901 family phage tail tape measure protein